MEFFFRKISFHCSEQSVMWIKKEICTIGIDMGGTKIAVGPYKDGKLLNEDIVIEKIRSWNG